MRLLKLSAMAVAIIIVIAGIIGLLIPKEYAVSRSISINASKDIIHDFVGDLDNWQQWTTWKLDDPSIAIFKGSKSHGVGASQSWKGDSGEGKLEFTSSSLDKGIVYDLYFDGGDQKSVASMLYTRQGNATVVTWKMSGTMDVPILGGYFAMMLDGMIGTMFKRGLTRLKTVAEKKKIVSRSELFKRIKLPKKGVRLTLAEVREISLHFGLTDLWQKIKTDPPQHSFTSDGCSLWMNSWKGISIYPACFLHDMKYWSGHKNEDVARLIADAELLIDIATLLNSTAMAETMYGGVRVGGSDVFKTPFRWGYGRN